ncbi:MAG: prepilin-type cleavage/methylation domain-containing protein [Prochlorococcus sp.]
MKDTEASPVCNGFCLAELLIASCLGMLLFAVALRLIFTDLAIGGAMALRLREKSLQRRTLALIKDDLAEAYSWQVKPRSSSQWPCPLAGRTPVLVIHTTADDALVSGSAIIYSVGAAPSSIWRGAVLMRCGPAYKLSGESSLGSRFLNRVVLDGLPAGGAPEEQGFVARPDHQLPVLHLELRQRLGLTGGRDQWIRSKAAV